MRLLDALFAPQMIIRESNEEDREAIEKVHLDAFDESEREVVSRLTLDLLEDASAFPLLSLVAVDGDAIVGHILFTSVSVEEASMKGGYILAPLAVKTSQQRSGVGGKLIAEGLEILRSRGGSFVMVLGDPNYYSRSGFATSHRIKPPYDIAYPEAWMAQALQEGALDNLEGTIKCADSLSVRELW